MSKAKLLYVSSNHMVITPGGLESYTQDVYEAFRDSDDFEPIYLARAGSPFTESTCYHGWSPFAMVGDDPNQYLFYTETFQQIHCWDPVYGRWWHKQYLTRFFREFLLAHKPDIVHFQHTIFLGYDILRVTRNALPDVPIVYTLHEYVPICNRDGQMVRVGGEELCRDPSPRRCNECYPKVSPQEFYMRKRFIQSHMSVVDYFIAPSEYVRDRYVDWGIPPEKIGVEPQGMEPVTDRVPDEAENRPRNRFAFFGQLNPYKGADILLEAMNLLGEDFDGHLWIFGANLEVQVEEWRKRIKELLSADSPTVTFVGPYERPRLAQLMAGIDWVVVPSIWWETGPLVVMEAFQYGRPVICSDIGGMSEKVTDHVNGLHFRRRDAEHLAEVMLEAAETPGLWDQLREGIPADPPRLMSDHIEALSSIYKRVLAERSGAAPRRALEGIQSA